MALSGRSARSIVLPLFLVQVQFACTNVSLDLDAVRSEAELAAQRCLDEMLRRNWIDIRNTPIEHLVFKVGTHPEMPFWKINFFDDRQELVPDFGSGYMCLSGKETLSPSRIDRYEGKGDSKVEIVRAAEWAEDGYYTDEELAYFTLDRHSTWFVGTLGGLTLDVLDVPVCDPPQSCD